MEFNPNKTIKEYKLTELKELAKKYNISPYQNKQHLYDELKVLQMEFNPNKTIKEYKLTELKELAKKYNISPYQNKQPLYDELKRLTKFDHNVNIDDYRLIELKTLARKYNISPYQNKQPLYDELKKISRSSNNEELSTPIIKQSKGEKIIEQILIDSKIPFEREKKFQDLKYKGYLRFDFFIIKNKKKTAIEYDGIQHFRPVEYFGGEKSFQSTKIRDNIKNNYCKKNNINLIRIKYDTTFKNIKKKIADIQ